MSPFEPTGDRARWRVLYEHLRDKRPGDMFTYAEMGEALGLDPDADRQTMQLAMRRAAREFEQVDKHALDSVTNVGYRVVAPVEHMQLARRQQRRSNRALVSGKSKVVNVDLNGVDPEVRKAFEVMATAFSMQMDFNRRMDVRQRRLEEAVGTITDRTSRSEEEVAELRARLERLEQGRESA